MGYKWAGQNGMGDADIGDFHMYRVRYYGGLHNSEGEELDQHRTMMVLAETLDDAKDYVEDVHDKDAIFSSVCRIELFATDEWNKKSE